MGECWGVRHTCDWVFLGTSRSESGRASLANVCSLC